MKVEVFYAAGKLVALFPPNSRLGISRVDFVCEGGGWGGVGWVRGFCEG